MNHGFNKLVRGFMLLLLFLTLTPAFSQTTTIISHAGSKSTTSKNKKGSTPNSKTKGVLNGHEWVDLGLPSGTKWATCNVGAKSSWQSGEYYAWGEVSTKKTYTIDNYKWLYNEKFTKYCFSNNEGYVDNKQLLEDKDDVATLKWGEKWCMPTTTQFAEITDDRYCVWNWCDSYSKKYNGTPGYEIISKKNGNKIFLPCVGAYGKNYSLEGYGEEGAYFAKDVDKTESRQAGRLRFKMGGYMVKHAYRFCGLPIRPVVKK